MAGVARAARGTGVAAAAFLDGRRIELPVVVARATEQAIAAVRRSGELLPRPWEPLARLVLRGEARASCALDDVNAPLEEVALAEILPPSSGATATVADAVAVLSKAIDAARDRPLSVPQLHAWHERLMAHAGAAHSGAPAGRFRTEPYSPAAPGTLDVVDDAPSSELIPALMDDLVGFANTSDLDPITQAAVLHAQLQTINPYAQGNGMLARTLVSWSIVRRTNVPVPPPVSAFVAQDRAGYRSALTLFRRGEDAAWVDWFARVIERSATASATRAASVEQVVEGWRRRLAAQAREAGGRVTRSGAVVWAVLDLLPEQPVLSAPFVADRFRVTNEAARLTLRRLAAFGIVSPLTRRSGSPGRPTSWWVAEELVEAASRWE